MTSVSKYSFIHLLTVKSWLAYFLLIYEWWLKKIEMVYTYVVSARRSLYNPNDRMSLSALILSIEEGLIKYLLRCQSFHNRFDRKQCTEILLYSWTAQMSFYVPEVILWKTKWWEIVCLVCNKRWHIYEF